MKPESWWDGPMGMIFLPTVVVMIAIAVILKLTE